MCTPKAHPPTPKSGPGMLIFKWICKNYPVLPQHPTLGWVRVPLGCTYCENFLGRDTLGYIPKRNHITSGYMPLTKKSTNKVSNFVFLGHFSKEFRDKWFWGQFQGDFWKAKLWTYVSPVVIGVESWYLACKLGGVMPPRAPKRSAVCAPKRHRHPNFEISAKLANQGHFQGGGRCAVWVHILSALFGGQNPLPWTKTYPSFSFWNQFPAKIQGAQQS